ncbi:MAG: elongation factor G [Clostridia bacterium]|nr:elongation factor G [Clostridia bacterium]
MKQYSATNIKNIALLGHGNSGKTTLADAILYYGKATDRIGKSADSTLALDFDAEEKKRKVSVSTALYPVEIGGDKINIIDAPGQFDFAAGVSEALSAADSALIVLSGKSGLTVGAQKAYDAARKNGKPVAFFINKLDSVHAHFYRVVSIITGHYGGVICPVVVPFVEGEQVTCYINLITGKAYTYDGLNAKEYTPVPDNSDISSMRAIMLEAVASTDEALMDKYFGGEPFTEDEIISALKNGMKTGDLCPVFCGVGQDGAAIPMLVDILAKIAPSAAESTVNCTDGENESTAAVDENGPAALVVFKTIADPFVGKLSYFKVVSGTVKADTRLVSRRTGNEEKLSKVMWIKAGKQEDAPAIVAGDIGAVAKLGNVLTGDTLCEAAFGKSVKMPAFPLPQLTMAVYPKVKGDEDKIAQGLTRLMEEDPTINFTVNTETKEQLLSGLGEQHIDVIISKLAAKFGVNVELKTPRVAYRETIRKTVKVQGKHKKQSGGHGQYGDVWIEFSPCESDEMIFEEKVFGGSVPKNFFPAVEKGLRDSVQKGVLAGYPVVGLKATLLDGSYHPVDSSEMAFKTAAGIAYKDGLPQAGPVLLEPIGTLNVTIPEDNMGDVIGDINKRRGRVIGMNPVGGKLQEIVAEVPMAEMSDFSTAMRSITQGRAEFTLAFERYEEVPSHIAGKVIEAAKAE